MAGARPGYQRRMSEPVDQHPEPVIVRWYSHRGEAEVGLAHLADSGIVGHIVDDVEGGAVPVDGEPGVRLMVAAKDADAAEALLA